MNPCPVQQSGSVELLFYGELEAAARAGVTHHLARCAQCRRAWEDLECIRAALAARADVNAPPGGDWTRFMAGLSQTIAAAEPRHARAVVVPLAGKAPVRISLGRHVGYLAMAALLALVTLSVAYLAHSRSVAGDAELPPGPAAAADAQPDGSWTIDAAFASLSEQHFERSKLVVLGLVNRDPKAASDWEYERQLASALLSDTRLYRQAAQEQGFTNLAGILDDLELVLLQASVVEAPQPETLEQIQRLIEKRDLIAKMNVVTTMAGI